MKVVYYYDKELKCCPVKIYLAKFIVSKNDNAKIKNNKIKLLADIDKKIIMILGKNGRPWPPIATPIKEYGCIEIKHRKNQDVLIRIVYFTYNDLMVLLNAFEKPDNYDTTRIKREVDKQFQIAIEYKKQFVINQKYEDY